MSKHVQLGDKLYLGIQLHENTSSKRVFIDLLKSDGTLLKPRFEIIHQLNGAYSEETETMPVDLKISAHYFIFESDGTTVATDSFSNQYSIEQEDFMRDLTGEIIESNLDAQVSSISVTDAEIIGSIDSEGITGTIIEESLTGTVEAEQTLEGEVIDG